MKKNRWIRIAITGILLIFMLACTISLGDSQNSSEEENLKLQLTVQALQMTQSVSSASQNQQPQPAQQQAQPAGQQPANDSNDDADSSQDEEVDDDTPCNSSKFVSESVKDGTVFKAGEKFIKSWTLRNAGDCDWTEDYVFEFEEGSRMGGESSIKVNTVIEPNETVTFQVNLTAPDEAGDYTGVWRLKSDDGEKLGKYWVKITVGTPAGPFAVTSVSFSTAATPIDLVCPDNVKVTAKVTASGAGTATYRWEDCEGDSSTGSITFDSAGTKSISHNVFIGWTDIHWAQLYIDTPNHQWFGPKEFEVFCNP